jgi:hypothetical protein
MERTLYAGALRQPGLRNGCSGHIAGAGPVGGASADGGGRPPNQKGGQSEWGVVVTELGAERGEFRRTFRQAVYWAVPDGPCTLRGKRAALSPSLSHAT